ncbi:MAG: peptidoglycan-binding domain-containing protein [Gammaproteobacteria bacterium]
MMRPAVYVVLSSLTLTSCGTTTKERGLSGAGIGASAGAVVGAVTGLSVLQGALIGGAAGGLTGALTNENQINLGKPVWKQGAERKTSASQASPDGSAQSHIVRNIQSGLTQLGYAPGPADGVLGAKTKTAIRAYQQNHGLLVDGEATAPLAEHIQRQL